MATKTTSSRPSRARTTAKKPAKRVDGRQGGPATEPAPAVTVTDEHPSGKAPRRLPDYANDWPKRGGFGDDVPQPWDLDAQGIVAAAPASGDPSVAQPITVLADGEQIELAPGAPNVIAPIVLDHGRPILASGSIDLGPGPAVAGAVTELGQLLALIGYPNSVSRGQNHLGIVDDSIMGAVEKFRDDFDVREDPSGWQRNGRVNAQTHVGPWTWEAILRVAERIEADSDEDRRHLTHRRR